MVRTDATAPVTELRWVNTPTLAGTLQWVKSDTKALSSMIRPQAEMKGALQAPVQCLHHRLSDLQHALCFLHNAVLKPSRDALCGAGVKVLEQPKVCEVSEKVKMLISFFSFDGA